MTRNSNDMGGTNPSTNEVDTVGFVQEYIVGLLSAQPANRTQAVPEPSEALMRVAGLLAIGAWCWRRGEPRGN